ALRASKKAGAGADGGGGTDAGADDATGGAPEEVAEAGCAAGAAAVLIKSRNPLDSTPRSDSSGAALASSSLSSRSTLVKPSRADSISLRSYADLAFAYVCRIMVGSTRRLTS